MSDAVENVMSSDEDGVLVRVKVVSGASRTRVAGLLGDRLKVTVSAPPEAGKANKAVRDVLARLFGVVKGDVKLANSQTTPNKTYSILGVTLREASERLSKCLSAANGKH